MHIVGVARCRRFCFGRLKPSRKTEKPGFRVKQPGFDHFLGNYKTNLSSIAANQHRCLTNHSSIAANGHRYLTNPSSIAANLCRLETNQHRFVTNQHRLAANGHGFVANQRRLVTNRHRFATNQHWLVANLCPVATNGHGFAANQGRFATNQHRLAAAAGRSDCSAHRRRRQRPAVLFWTAWVNANELKTANSRISRTGFAAYLRIRHILHVSLSCVAAKALRPACCVICLTTNPSAR